MPIEKPIPIEKIPENKSFGKAKSKVLEIIKKCVKGEALPITNTYKETPTHQWKTTDQPKIPSITSYIRKEHKKGYLQNIKITQRQQYNNDGTKTITLYLIKE